MKDLTGELKNKKINNIKLLNYGFIKKIIVIFIKLKYIIINLKLL